MTPHPDPVAEWMTSKGFIHSKHSDCWLLPESAPQLSIDDAVAVWLYQELLAARIDEAEYVLGGISPVLADTEYQFVKDRLVSLQSQQQRSKEEK